MWGATFAFAFNFQVQAAMDTALDEIAMLPAYCDAKVGRQMPDAVNYWRDQMGHENWIHMHHYCAGLIELNRYYRSSTGRKKANLGSAVNEFSGMLKGWSPEFYLRPEAHLNRGRALKFMGNLGQALGDFLKALELNPRLAPATLELADLYKKTGKNNEALAVLKKGLEHSPSTKSLRRRYQELGGDLKAIPEAPVPVAESTEPVLPEAVSEPSGARQSSELDTATVTEPKIGNKTNPWCRFCPAEPAETTKPTAN
jgi:tetratricopeptide (TPR) repeat protein